MGVSFGTLEVEPLSFGSIDLSSIHLGNTLIWEKVVPEVNYIFRDIDANGNLTLATGALEDGSGITNVGDYGMASIFYQCAGLTGSIDLSNLKTIGVYGLSLAFVACKNITNVYLTNLEYIDSGGMTGCFNTCTNLENVYFNSLKTTSFGSYVNQFTDMMSSTGSTKTHTLHFPSNLETTIQGLSGYPLFGGTSGYVVLSFDLPATS